MKSYLPVIALVVISLILWIFLFTFRKSRNKNILLYFKQLAEKYGLLLDESNKIGAVIYPLLKGVYKNRQIGIGCYIKNDSKKKLLTTYVRVECSNQKKISFDIVKKTKNSSLSDGGSIVNMMDSEFDEKFIVTSNSPEYLLPTFTFNIKYSLVQVANLGFKGELKLENNVLDYTEPELMNDENAKTRIELIMHILCDIADEFDKNA